jgi:hypothetical protein
MSGDLNDSRWLTPGGAAELVGVRPDVLEQWAMQGQVEARIDRDGTWYDRASVAELVVRLQRSKCPLGHPLRLRRDGTRWCARCRSVERG